MKKVFLKIGNKIVGNNQPVFIIAEAGVNHNGDLKLALDLIDAAAFAGADAIKFQTFRAEQVVTISGKMADYQKKNLGKEESQLEMLRKLELKEHYYPALIQRAKEKKIVFLSTPHGGFESVDFLQKLKIPAFKFGSGDITNLPLLEYAAKFKKPMLISSGMSTLQEVKEAVAAIKKAGNNKMVILQCTTNYPSFLKDANLRVIETFKKKLGVLVGYSDHTLDNQAVIMAAMLGACVIEKHLTIDKKLAGPDHVASAEPAEFKLMVEEIRKVPVLLGSSMKKPAQIEKKYIPIARKSIVAFKKIKKGQKFTKENLTIKRPGTGILPKYFNEVLGKKALQDIDRDELITKEMYK